MDGLSAVGLAANLIQFVSFAGELISKAKEIYSSLEDAPGEVLTLEIIHKQLGEISVELDACLLNGPNTKAPVEIIKRQNKVRDLSKACKADCDMLLALVEKLKVKPGASRKWGSFKTALLTVWKSDELAKLQKRLHQTQASITMELCGMTNHWHRIHQLELETLRKESCSLSTQQSGKLDEIAATLSSLRQRIETAEIASKIALQAPPSHAGAGQLSPDSNLLAADDIASLEASLSHLHLSVTNLTKQNAILKSLSFENRLARHGSIPEAHTKTFRWVFDKRLNTSHGDLLEWLKHGDRIFWVSGKPGSGKSTFMKFIADVEDTRRALATWAYPNRAIVASHYFWSSGTATQRSQQGVLQTLLFDIFRQCPHFISDLCNERWSGDLEKASCTWTLPELHKALREISERQDLGVKFCFFIDGLDEYEGDHLDFCAALNDLSTSAHIKLCLASRPWNAFEDAFGRSCPKLYIHDLTRGDIEAYTTDRLTSHPRWKDLQTESSSPEWLIQETVKRSSGVFLWVFLVTKLLREGLTEYNSFWDLRERLESFPCDLEPFFKHMLETVEPFHHRKMASTLSIAVAKGDPMNIIKYHFHDLEYEDQDYAISMPLRELTGLEAMGNRTARQLNGRCRGLLEVDINGSVNFLHRTLADFLRLGEMTLFLAEKAPSGFSANLSLLKAFVASAKSSGFPKLHQEMDNLWKGSNLPSDMRDIFAYAGFAIEENATCRVSTCRLLEDLERCIEANRCGDTDTISKFRDQVLRFDLLDYLHFKLQKYGGYLECCKTPALLAAASLKYPERTFAAYEEDGKPRWSSKTINMLRFLLENGQNPNQALSDGVVDRSTTPWIITMEKMIVNEGERRCPTMSEHFISGLQGGLFTAFLSNSAQRNAKVYRLNGQKISNRISVSVAWADFLFVCFSFPADIGLESMYLDVLDDFMLGANFRISKSFDEAYPGQWSFEDSGIQKGIFCKFFTYLQTLSAESSTRINKRLLSEVSDRVLSKTLESGQGPLDPAWPIIEHIFEAKVVKRLRDKHSTVGAMGTMVSADRVKRKRSLLDKTGKKRQKTLSRVNPRSAGNFGGYDGDIE